jgi:hypothetical protein
MTPDESLWQRLEADFARVLGEIPKPEGPEPEEEEAREDACVALVGS